MVVAYENLANQFRQSAEEIRRTPADEEADPELRDEFLNRARGLKRLAGNIDSTAHGISDQTDLFRKMKVEQIRRLMTIIRQYRIANEIVINAINDATR